MGWVKTSQAEIFRVKIELPPDPVEGEGIINVYSSPSNAEVYIDENYMGVTPLSISLASETYQVGIRLDGYHDYVKNITVKDGVAETINVNLIKVEEPQTGLKVLLGLGLAGAALKIYSDQKKNGNNK